MLEMGVVCFRSRQGFWRDTELTLLVGIKLRS